MIGIDQKVKDFAIHVGLNNIVARDTSQKGQQRLTMENCTSSSRALTPADRIRFQLWPSIKRADILLRAHAHEISEIRQSPYRDRGPKTLRKVRASELDPAKREQQNGRDSPTIPGHYPTRERSSSVPGRSRDRRTCGDLSLAPISEFAPRPSGAKKKRLEPSPIIEDKRVRFHETTGDIVNTKGDRQRHPEPRATQKGDHSAESRKQEEEEEEEEAPEVPPKSPNLVAKVSSNRAQQAPAGGNGNTQKSVITPKKDAGLYNGQDRPGPNIAELPDRPPTPPDKTALFASRANASSRTASPSKKHVNFAGDKSTADVSGSLPESQVRQAGHHKRNMSEDSIMNRGRPTKKRPAHGEIPIQERHEIPDDPPLALPLGTPVHMASMTMPGTEVEKLQKQARAQAESFTVLQNMEAKMLTNELHALDKKCEYLRGTHSSLRSGRRNLHARMISYLKSPKRSKSSASDILKQEEALAELDRSIDEWYAKLEDTESRRSRIQQKLLEHLAATLVLDQPTFDRKNSGEQTPPQSPPETDSPDGSGRNEVESIKVYADEELQALFANVEREMQKMVSDEQSASPSSVDRSPGG